jgi:hypothetical protein
MAICGLKKLYISVALLSTFILAIPLSLHAKETATVLIDTGVWGMQVLGGP